MPRPIKAIVHTNALRHNLERVRSIVAKTESPSKVWAVVKADAYGHGIEAAVGAFVAADGLALLDLNEAARARQAGWDKPILLLEGPFEATDLDAVGEFGITAVIHSPEQLELLATWSGRPLNVYVKLDTGMTRLGFVQGNLQDAFARIDALKVDGKIGNVTLMTHFACADSADGLDDPLQRFVSMTTSRRENWCLSNSAASLAHAGRVAALAHAHGRQLWSRPGICLYGGSPFGDQNAMDLGLESAMTLKSAIISVKDVAAGQGIGYGHMFVASEPMRVGVVACGYADGYPRHAPTGTPIAVGGHMSRILGRVSMDMIIVDLTGLADVHVGTEVVLWGQGGPPADEVAKAAGTISYELLSGVTARVSRVIA